MCHIARLYRTIRKDYPLTGVLKLNNAECVLAIVEFIRKDYPLTGVLKRNSYVSKFVLHVVVHQEGLPAYWGIETGYGFFFAFVFFVHQEGLPAYWGIETDTGQS